MKFQCERDTLVSALATVARSISTRNGVMPILSGIRMTANGNHLSLVGSDLELTIQTEIAVLGESDGVAVVPAKLFSDVIRSLTSETVGIAINDEEATLTAGRSNFSIRTLPAHDFPRVNIPEGKGVVLDQRDLAGALGRIVVSASKDDARPILTGVLFTSTPKGLRLVSTDSYRLGICDLPGVTMLEEGQKVLVPAKALAEVSRAFDTGEIEIVLGTREATFRIGRTQITSRLIEGSFPDYKQLIPESYMNKLTVDAKDLDGALRRVRLVGQGNENAPIRIGMSQDGADVSIIAQEVGRADEMLEADFEGREITIGFSPEFVLDGIEACGTKQVTIECVDPKKPAAIRGVGLDGYLYLIMPVKIIQTDT